MTLFKARHKHSVAYSNVASLRMTNQIIFTLKSNVVNVFNMGLANSRRSDVMTSNSF